MAYYIYANGARFMNALLLCRWSAKTRLLRLCRIKKVHKHVQTALARLNRFTKWWIWSQFENDFKLSVFPIYVNFINVTIEESLSNFNGIFYTRRRRAFYEHVFAATLNLWPRAKVLLLAASESRLNRADVDHPCVVCARALKKITTPTSTTILSFRNCSVVAR